MYRRVKVYSIIQITRFIKTIYESYFISVVNRRVSRKIILVAGSIRANKIEKCSLKLQNQLKKLNLCIEPEDKVVR